MKKINLEAFSGNSRRDFLRLSAMSAAAFTLQDLSTVSADGAASSSHLQTMINVPYAAMNPRIGLIGTGGRGTSLLTEFLANDGQIVALCDVVKSKAEHGASLVQKNGQRAPTLYTNGDHAYESLVSRHDIDLVVIATPWNWHVPMALAAMKEGKHVAVEVPAALTIEDCWKLVHTSEQTRRHCVMLENCCYGYNETLILNMVQANLFGDLLYGEGGYVHDLRELLFSSESEGLWRRAFHTKFNGNLYPTHGLGPVANYMGINRGDRFDYMVSMSTPARGLDAYRREHVAAGDPKYSERYINGDMNTSLIKTANGLTITLKHDTSNAHPYDRYNVIGGTKGVFEDYPPRIYLDRQNTTDAWGSIDPFKEKYESPLWKEYGKKAKQLGGHGGMDYIECFRLLQCMRNGLAPDMDVYDAVTWSVPWPLSLQSVAQGSAPVKFPDFTGGRWKERHGSPIGQIRE
jgi:hypothetical protein